MFIVRLALDRKSHVLPDFLFARLSAGFPRSTSPSCSPRPLRNTPNTPAGLIAKTKHMLPIYHQDVLASNICRVKSSLCCIMQEARHAARVPSSHRNPSRYPGSRRVEPRATFLFYMFSRASSANRSAALRRGNHSAGNARHATSRKVPSLVNPRARDEMHRSPSCSSEFAFFVHLALVAPNKAVSLLGTLAGKPFQPAHADFRGSRDRRGSQENI